MTEAGCDQILRSFIYEQNREAREILKKLQVPAKQQADLCCFVLLGMANIKE